MLLGRTKRLEYVGDLKRHRARGYAMAGNRNAVVTDRSLDILEVHPPSIITVIMAGVTVECYSPRPAMG